jgi:hypothetical protein
MHVVTLQRDKSISGCGKCGKVSVHSRYTLKQWIDLGLLCFTFDSVDGTDSYFMPTESGDYSQLGDCSSMEYSHQTIKVDRVILFPDSPEARAQSRHIE